MNTMEKELIEFVRESDCNCNDWYLDEDQKCTRCELLEKYDKLRVEIEVEKDSSYFWVVRNIKDRVEKINDRTRAIQCLENIGKAISEPFMQIWMYRGGNHIGIMYNSVVTEKSERIGIVYL